MDDHVPFGSQGYLVMLIALVFSRGMDFLSTWIATPNLALEGNPIAKKLGWRGGLFVNGVLVFILPFWPATAIVVSTASVLVAARNFQSAWLMRSLGEDAYREWYVSRIRGTRFRLFLFCLAGNTLLTAAVGAVLVCFTPAVQLEPLSPSLSILPLSVGMGIITYAIAVAVFTGLGTWRIRESLRREDRLHTALPDRRQPVTLIAPQPVSREAEE